MRARNSLGHAGSARRTDYEGCVIAVQRGTWYISAGGSRIRQGLAIEATLLTQLVLSTPPAAAPVRHALPGSFHLSDRSAPASVTSR